MITLKEYTHEIIKESSAKVRFGESVIGNGVNHLSGAAESALKTLSAIIKKAPGPEEQQKAVKAFMDSAAGKVLKGVGHAALGAGKAARWAFTSKGSDGKRKLNIIKGLMISGPSAGMYYGMKSGRMKAKKSRYYGQRKPPSVYQDPRRRLY